MQSIEHTRTQKEVIEQLRGFLPENSIKTRLLDRISYAADAGFYQLIPLAVLQPASEEEVAAIFRISKQFRVPVTFRTGGTSLSGQAVTDGLLVDLSKYWLKIKPSGKGETVTVQPGAIGSVVNQQLRAFGRKIGPDPASINSAMMGGIISNNASGMCCGVVQNSYHTLKQMRFMLTDGRVFDTRAEGEEQRFEKECPELASTLMAMRQQVLAHPGLLEKVRNKYQIKNTVGYALNALIDFETPLAIFSHLLVGAEGTLAFISESELLTVPDYPYKATGLLFFSDIYTACAAIEPFSRAGARAIELMDRSALRSVEHVPGVPGIIKSLPPSAAALLIEFQGETEAVVAQQLQALPAIVENIQFLEEPLFSQDAMVQALYWKVRKGMFPSVGAVRARGTTVILEDVAVPVANLGKAIHDLQDLFVKYGYDNAIIFGHAKDGNIHFVVTQKFESDAEIDRYDRFIRDVVHIITAKYKGSLKAEHGTGRNMAPFVQTEWGPELYSLMKQIKLLTDPDNLLNPGVIINEDSDAHIRNLKALPSVEEEVDKCIECGFCEHKCPSRNITMTPRRRIVVRRALKSFAESGETVSHRELLKEYQYDGLDTCAVDGLCATACPVDIDTGKLVKRLRNEQHGELANKTASWVANHFSFVAASVKLALRSGALINNVFGTKAMVGLTKGIRRIIPSFPLWSPHLHPAPGLKKFLKKNNVAADNSVVYFPSCINRLMGEKDPSDHIVAHFSSLAGKTGIELYIPPGVSGACCGQIFSSKGFRPAYYSKANEFIEKMWNWTDEGKRPVVIDFSSCVYTALHSTDALTEENKKRLQSIRLLDSIEFLKQYVIPKANTIQKKNEIVLHPVCSLEKMGTQSVLLDVAMQLSEKVIVPQSAGCCGMAGDRGFLFPELTSSATAPEAAEAKCTNADGYYSTSKTCEIALSGAVGREYHSMVKLADEVIR